MSASAATDTAAELRLRTTHRHTTRATHHQHTHDACQPTRAEPLHPGRRAYRLTERGKTT
eukprot:196509-Prorocentrum_minimum.AAC.2